MGTNSCEYQESENGKKELFPPPYDILLLHTCTIAAFKQAQVFMSFMECN